MTKSNSGQARRRQASRTRMLEAAARLFAERGYEPTSIDEIAAEAGVVKGTFYYSFSGKEELLLAVAARQSGEVGQEVARRTERGDKAVEILACVLRRVADWAQRNPKIARAAYPVALRRGLEGKPRENVPSFRQLLTDIVARGQQRGELRGDLPAHVLAVHLSMSYMTETLMWLVDGGKPSLRKRAERCLELFLTGARAPGETK
ncbi:MAG: TetR/AcrR family transcriptional regulator [Pirellulaceae bacterium]